jgi:hypothetical protein
MVRPLTRGPAKRARRHSIGFIGTLRQKAQGLDRTGGAAAISGGFVQLFDHPRASAGRNLLLVGLLDNLDFHSHVLVFEVNLGVIAVNCAG